jgi:hypothetical protein
MDWFGKWKVMAQQQRKLRLVRYQPQQQYLGHMRQRNDEQHEL